MLLDPWDSVDELFHILQQGANNQVIGKKAAYVGYIVKWFPNNTVIVSNPLGGTIPKPIDPLDTDPGVNTTGIPVLSNPMPLSTAFCGTPGVNPINPSIRAGIVLAPLGGALPSSKDQALGEQVLVIILNNKQGYQATAFMMFDDVAKPPSLSIPVTSEVLKPGEWLYVNPSGTHSHWRNDGSLLTYAMNPKEDADGGNLYLFAGAKADAFGGSICLQTGLVNSQPSPPELAGDIQIVARNNIEMAALDVGLETTYSIIMAAGTHLQLGAALDAVIQSVDVGMLASNNFVATADQNIILNSNEANIGLNALAETSNVLIGAGNTISMTAYNGGVEIYAGVGSVTINAADVLDLSSSKTVSLVAHDNMNISSTFGSILMQANWFNQNFGISAGNNLTLATINGKVRIASTDTLEIVGAADGEIITQDDLLLQVSSGALNINAQEINETALTDLGLTSTLGAINVQTLGGGDINLTAAGKTTGSINLTALLSISCQSQSSMTWDCTSTGSMTFTTKNSGHFVVNCGVMSLTGNGAVGLVSTTSTVTIIASGVSVVQGSNVILRDGSGNNPLQLMTIELINAFNNHTHGGVTTGGGSTATPDSPLSPGYPLTTDAALAN